MKGLLPREVLARDKSPLIEDPIINMAQKYPLFPDVSLCTEMQEFVDVRKIPARPHDIYQTSGLIRVHVMDHWLKNRG
jgi:hypothetical protein